MWPVWAGAADSRSLVVIVAIGAVYTAGNCPRGQQTRDVKVLANRLDRVERGVGALKLEPGIGLGKLAIHACWSARQTISMAAKTELVFVRNGGHDATAGVNPLYPIQGS